MNWFKLLAAVIVTALWFPEAALAGSQCQLKLIKHNGKKISENLRQGKDSDFKRPMGLRQIFLTVVSNDVVVNIVADASLSLSLHPTQKLLLPKNVKVVSLQCQRKATPRKRGESQTVKLTASQILQLFAESPSEAMKGLVDALGADVRGASKLIAAQGYTDPSIARSAKSAFGDTKATVREVFKGVYDFKGSSQSDLQSIAYALRSTFSSDAASLLNLSVAMEEAKLEPALIGKLLEGISASP